MMKAFEAFGRLLRRGPARPRAYRFLSDSEIEPGARTGTVVYELTGWNHGCASSDTKATGYPCRSVSLRPDGHPPYFVVPVQDLAPAVTQSGRTAEAG